LLFALLLAPVSAQPALETGVGFDLTRTEIVNFVDGVVARDSLDRKAVLKLLAKAQPQPRILELVNRPAERVLSWWEYHDHFVTERRIAEGAQFWVDHRASLERIAAERGVAPEYIVGILGAETYYGRITGRDRVLDALTTLAFDYPPRSDYFRSELEQFLLLVKEEKIDPLTVTGSYTGAMGAAQFMPSNYRRYAVDENSDKRRDLWTDWDDIIASIANYLHEKGWEAGAPVLAETKLDPDPTFQLDPKLELNETVASLNARGVKLEMNVPGDTQALLIAAEQRDGPAYRVGFRNFYVITRYNSSARYAMAVHDLAQAILQRVPGAQP
jgi:membrane-bound lytic murein transglycosylase B